MSLKNLIGQTLDEKYQIERELGRGGMGAVYLATHVGTERPVALKVIAPEFMQRREFVERFRREARAAGRLRHPNVVDVTDFGIAETEWGNMAYLVMEYLDGCTLGEILEEEKRLPLNWTLDILEQTASAVDEAHRQGIIHRDLKPDNIWLEPNQRGGYTVKVLDFGIAKLEEPMMRARAEGFYEATTLANSFAGEITENATLALPGGNENGTLALPASEENATLALPANGKSPADSNTLIKDFESEGTGIFAAARKTAVEGAPQVNQEAPGTKILSSPTSTNRPPHDAAKTAALTRVGAVLGTPLYMSPEQCRGEKLDPRADVYSLGVIAYQMLSGAPPFQGDFTEVLKAHQETEPPPIEDRKIRRQVKDVVLSAMAKNPEERPASAKAFASRLRAHSEGVGTLIRRALVIYSEHLPTFLTLALMLFIPIAVFTIGQVVFSLLTASEAINSTFGMIATGFLQITTPFVNVFFGAVITGVTTWLVAQHLAVPLRPIALRPAFREARRHLRTFAGTVMLSSVLAITALIICSIIAVILLVVSYKFVGSVILFAALSIAVVGLFLLASLAFFVLFSLLTPVVMMEGLKGRAAIRRSIQLVRRSLRTVIAVTFIHLFVPMILAIVLSVGIKLMMQGAQVSFVKKTPAAEKSVETQPAAQVDNQTSGPEVKFDTRAGAKIQITNGGDEKEDKKTPDERKAEKIDEVLHNSLFQLIWLPIAVLIGSLASVVTALLYLKTRQAGGETMQHLLGQFEETELPQSRWQRRVKERLELSGRTTSKT